jgi:AcrR family transcriptional regulator
VHSGGSCEFTRFVAVRPMRSLTRERYRREPTTRTAKRSRMDGAERQQLILETAAMLFAQNGYAATTTEEIASAAGVRKGTLYHFYPTKELLLYEVLRRAIDLPQRSLTSILATTDDPVEVLRRFIRQNIRDHHDLRPYMVTFTREPLSAVTDERLYRDLNERRKQYQLTWESALARATESGAVRRDIDQRLVTFGVLGMLNWMFKWYSPDGRCSPEEIADTFTKIALEGLLTPSRHVDSDIDTSADRPLPGLR